MSELLSVVVDDHLQRQQPFVVDDNARETTRQTMIPAAGADANAIDLLTSQARRLICLATETGKASRLGLRPVMQTDGASRATFTRIIEAWAGVSTGISARDRESASAVADYSAPLLTGSVTASEVLSIVACQGGDSIAPGRSRAVVSPARVKSLHPPAVFCEVLNDNDLLAEAMNCSIRLIGIIW